MPKYRVWVSWTVCADKTIEAESHAEVAEIANKMGTHEFNHQDYLSDSFSVDSIIKEEETE